LTALSSIKVEIMAVLKGVRLAVWLKKLTRDLGERDNNNNPFIPTLYCDNKGIVNLLYDMKHY
jgi:hypothetical protein